MISLADLHLAARVKGTAHDAYLTDLEVAAVAYAQRRLGFYIGAEATTTEYIEGAGHERLWLSADPAAAITEVLERGVPGADATTITAADDDGFLVRGACLVRKNGLAWVRGYEYEVSYTHGYAAGAEPAEIQQIVRTLVVHWFERRVPMPKIGEQHAFPVPHHLESLIQAARRPVL